MQVDVKIKPCVEEVEVLITAEKRTQFVNDLVEVIWDFDKHSVTTLTGYIDNRAYIIKVTDILRIFSLNQSVVSAGRKPPFRAGRKSPILAGRKSPIVIYNLRRFFTLRA